MNQSQSSFLQSAVPAALFTQREFGVPASITLAQAICESGWGQSALAKQANNFFGIKALAGAAPEAYAEFPTSEFVNGRAKSALAKFARYASPVESFTAHARLLADAARYEPAMVVRNKPAAFAAALQSCGYSTNPGYAASLLVLVKEFDLTQYDAPEQLAAARPGTSATGSAAPTEV